MQSDQNSQYTIFVYTVSFSFCELLLFIKLKIKCVNTIICKKYYY